MLKFITFRWYAFPIILICGLCYYFFCYLWVSPLTTVILVRHGDRTGEELNDLGLARAQELKRVLSTSNITTIYASTVNRTQQTAQPLATQLGLQLHIYNPNNLQAELVDDIKLHHRGEVILVVGHSDTVSPTIGLLGVSPAPPLIPGNEFDNLYVVTFGRKVVSKLVQMKYGAPTPL